jgi:hypothetical protein
MKNTVKNAIRHLVTKAYEVFAKDKNNISVVSLPGSVWEFETSVINHKDFADNFGKSYNLDMQLAECDNAIYDSNLRPISTLFPHNKASVYALSRDFVKYYNQYLNTDIVKKAKSDNIFAWFDFCGNPTTQSLELINTAIGKNVTYVFTFNTHWRCDTNVDRDVLSFAKSIDNKPVAIHTFVEKIALNAGLTIVWSFEYISNGWVEGVDGTAKPEITADTDTFIFTDSLLITGLKSQWMVAKGLDASFSLGEFRWLLEQEKATNKSAPMLSVGAMQGSVLLTNANILDGSWPDGH